MSVIVRVYSEDKNVILERATDDGWKPFQNISPDHESYVAEFGSPSGHPVTFRVRPLPLPAKQFYERQMTDKSADYVPWEDLPKKERKAWAIAARGPVVRVPMPTGAYIVHEGHLKHVHPDPAE